jgi:hypothetical protein
VFPLTNTAVFSLEPPISKLESEQYYIHAPYKLVYPSFSPLFCPNRGLKISCGDHSIWSSEEFPLQKFSLGLVAKFTFRVYSGETKGSVLAPCVIFVCFRSFHVLLRDSDTFCCATKPALSGWIYFVSKKFRNYVILYFVVQQVVLFVWNRVVCLESCCLSGIVLFVWNRVVCVESCCLSGIVLSVWNRVVRLESCCLCGIMLFVWNRVVCLKLCCLSGIVLHFLALLKTTMGVLRHHVYIDFVITNQ